MINLPLRLLLVLLPIGSAAAEESAPLVELYYHVFGPAIQTQSLQLLDDGSVVSETYDWTKSGNGFPHNRVVLCKLGSAHAEAALSEAKTALSGLPSTVDPTEFISLDGPYKTIRVSSGGKGNSSTLHEPESASTSGAQQFKDTWAKLAGALDCHGPDNSFKPNPLRGLA